VDCPDSLRRARLAENRIARAPSALIFPIDMLELPIPDSHCSTVRRTVCALDFDSASATRVCGHLRLEARLLVCGSSTGAHALRDTVARRAWQSSPLSRAPTILWSVYRSRLKCPLFPHRYSMPAISIFSYFIKVCAHRPSASVPGTAWVAL